MLHLACQVSKSESVSDQSFRRDRRSNATKETPLNVILKPREGVLTYPLPQPKVQSRHGVLVFNTASGFKARLSDQVGEKHLWS